MLEFWHIFSSSGMDLLQVGSLGARYLVTILLLAAVSSFQRHLA